MQAILIGEIFHIWAEFPPKAQRNEFSILNAIFAETIYTNVIHDVSQVRLPTLQAVSEKLPARVKHRTIQKELPFVEIHEGDEVLTYEDFVK